MPIWKVFCSKNFNQTARKSIKNLFGSFPGLIKPFSKQPFSSFARLEHVLQLALLKTFLISRRFRFSLRHYCVNSALEPPREQNDEMAASRATARI